MALLSAPLKLIARVDRDPAGHPKKTRTGHYRFALAFQAEDLTTVEPKWRDFAVVRGFRYDPMSRKIIPPSISLDKGTYLVAQLDTKVETELADLLDRYTTG